MKRIFTIIFIITIFVPQMTFASVEQIPYAFKAFNLVYSNAVPVIKNLKDVKRGTYLPGVYDSKILSFQALSTNANVQIKKKLEEERRKRLEQQMRLGNAEAAFDGKYIDIDLQSQTLTAFQDRQVIYKFKVSTGKKSTPTPPGTYRILNKYPKIYSNLYKATLPWWMAFRGDGYGIHELPIFGKIQEGATHLGIPVSGGCVRLAVGAAKIMYDWTNVGDLVYIHR